MLVFLKNFSADYVGWHQVGCELHTAKLKIEQLRNGPDKQCFREPRCPGDQAMPAGEKCDQQLLDDLLLPNDHFS